MNNQNSYFGNYNFGPINSDGVYGNYNFGPVAGNQYNNYNFGVVFNTKGGE